MRDERCAIADLQRARPLYSGSFTRLAVGNCDTHTFVETVEQCGAAARMLGMGKAKPRDVRGSSQPHGCYFNFKDDSLFFNPNGDRNNTDWDLVSMCSTPHLNPHRPWRGR